MAIGTQIIKYVLGKNATNTLKKIMRPVLSRFRKGNVVMFHIGRCGSTVLGDLLNQHPKIYWDGEIYYQHIPGHIVDAFSSKPGLVCTEGERLLRERMPLGCSRYYGFEVQPHLLKPFETVLPDYLHLLQKFGFTHFIVLKRKNYLRKMLSSLILLSNGRYHLSNSEKPSLNPVSINLENVEIKNDGKSLLSFFQEWDEQYDRLSEAVVSCGHSLSLTYEDDILANPYKGYRSVCDFLDLKPYDRSGIRYNRTNPFDLKEMILNYNEVASALKNTQYEWMLYE